MMPVASCRLATGIIPPIKASAAGARIQEKLVNDAYLETTISNKRG
jgi:hypothetical protein